MISLTNITIALDFDEDMYFIYNENIDTNRMFLCVKCKDIKECIVLIINNRINNKLSKSVEKINLKPLKFNISLDYILI